MENRIKFNHAVYACPVHRCVLCKIRLLFLQCANFTYTQITQLLPLVIILPLGNNKQDDRNIGVWDQFLLIDLKYFNRDAPRL